MLFTKAMYGVSTAISAAKIILLQDFCFFAIWCNKRYSVSFVEVACQTMNKKRENNRNSHLAILIVMVGCYLLFLGKFGQLAAQELRGKVYSLDEKGDTVPVYMARLQWKNTAVGAYTTPRGSYKLPYAQTDTLLVSYSFYKPDTLIIKSGERQRNIFINTTQPLQEVVVKKRKPKYVRKGNPAVELVERVIEHKKDNRIESVECYKSKVYKKMVMSFGRIKTDFQKNGFNRKLAFLEKYIDTIPPDTLRVLTLSLRETLSNRYYQESPHRNVNYVIARRIHGIDEGLDDEGLGTNLNAMFSEVNIFDNDIELMLNKFVSPLSSSLATLYYHYYITDTVEVDSISCIELSFAPVNSRTFGFTGRMYIVNDSSYALKKYAINVPVDINMNFVRQLRVEQEFTKKDSGLWAPITSETFASFSLVKRKKTRQIIVRQNTLWYDYELGTVLPDSLSDAGEEQDSPDVSTYKSGRWKKMRPIPLTAKESFIDSISTEFRRLPFFRALEKTAEIIATGYIATNKDRKQSRFDIGSVYNMISYNPMEGVRLRIGGMTTAKLHDHFFLTGYLAFGCKDMKFKYNATAVYSFDPKKRHYNESPKHALYFSSGYDMEMVGQSYSYIDRDNFLMSYSDDRFPASSAQYVRRHKLSYVHEWPSRFSLDTWLQISDNEVVGAVAYWRINSDGTIIPVSSYRDFEWCVNVRWAPGERVYNNQSGKDNLIRMAKNAPVLTLSHTAGILDGKSWYNRTDFSLEKRFWLSAFGYIDAKAQAGIVWDAVPFPKLYVPQSNQSLFLTPNTFCLMKPMEFIMDKYVALYATYHLKGWIFNRIPLWNRLKFREVVSFNGIYGGLSLKNTPSPNTPGLYVLPDSCSPMGKMPYMEITAGIENIFQILRIDYVRRLSYANGLSRWEKNGVRVSLDISF